MTTNTLAIERRRSGASSAKANVVVAAAERFSRTADHDRNGLRLYLRLRCQQTPQRCVVADLARHLALMCGRLLHVGGCYARICRADRAESGWIDDG